MESCSSNISIHQGMGTTQEERFLAALKTDYFLVDERTEIDFIQFAQKISNHLKFINNDNNEDGNWAPFFQWESTSILVQLFLWDIERIQANYEITKREITITANPAEQKKILIHFFENLNEEIKKVISKINKIDNQIAVKQYFLATQTYIEDKITFILQKITPATAITPLLSSYEFNKNTQQLFGLLLNWKLASKDSIQNQLENYAGHSPNYTLFLTFLKLLGIAQKQLNEFTKKQLDFYYKDVLQIKPANAIPDYVHLTIEPSRINNVSLLPKGTIFPAGKNTIGKNKYYAATSDQAINNIKIKSILSNYSSLANKEWKQANLLELNGKKTPFNVFANNAVPVEKGLLIASPLFFLSGGNRTILIKINNSALDTTRYKFYITSEKACIEISNKAGNILTLPASEKKIIAYNPEIHKEINLKTLFPVLKIVPLYPNEKITVDKLEIKVSVTGFKNFILGTDTGSVDTNKPFKPFGDFPRKGNGFVIGCPEFFIKKNAVLTFNINPPLFIHQTKTESRDKKKPNKHGYSHDRSYESTYQVNLAFLYDETKIEKYENGLWVDLKKFENSFTNTNPIEEYQEVNTLPDNFSKSGYLKITLNDAKYAGESFLNKYITAVKNGTSLPHSTTIDSILLDYTVTEVYTNKGAEKTTTPIDLYHILPFGYKKINESSFPLTENQPTGGELFLGFENVVSGNGLSLLFQLAEGTANPRQEFAALKWEYLKHNTWIELDSHEIGDETNGLTQSGLVQLSITEFQTKDTTILDPTLFWIKITVDKIDAICNCLGIHEQALKAVLVDYEQNGSVFLENTTKETISKLNDHLDFVKKVNQPYTSFGGKKQEDDNLLYQRSSERLRHKKRAITSWDYERLILQEFPEVFRVKCLNHYRYDSKAISNVSAGYITLIPIAKSNDYQNLISWKPLLSLGTMKRIKDMIQEVASPHARILVKSPTLEKIQLKFKVKYHDIIGADTQLYSNLLIKTINQYLSPWAFENDQVTFANTIEIASLIGLIDNQSFVDHITDFEVNQIILDATNEGEKAKYLNVKKIIPKTDFTLFIPNDTHLIEEIKNNC